LLKEVESPLERREIRRRVAEHLLVAARREGWATFIPYLRRMERLGYTTLFKRLWVCVMAAEATRGTPDASRKVMTLIANAERHVNTAPDWSVSRKQAIALVERARRLAGIPPPTGRQRSILATTSRDSMASLPIAERTFEWADGHGHVHASVHRPEKDPETGDYSCRFELVGLPEGNPCSRAARGVDSLQALHEAIQGIRAALEPFRGRLRWRGDEWLGLQPPVPGGFGVEIDRRFEKAIEREMNRFSRELHSRQKPTPKRPLKPPRTKHE
jgi:hypothetical protein